MTSAEYRSTALTKAFGPVHVLAVGVDMYPAKSGFKLLKKCASDAYHVLTAFKEVRQLNASPAHLKLLSSENSSSPPVRGVIFDAIHNLAESAGPGDRILFYYSGHGHRIDGHDTPFLVPQDAFNEDRPDAFISLAEVLSILNASAAKQRIVILDACLSGPMLKGKKLHMGRFSEKSLTRCLERTTGFAVLSSCAEDEASHEQSPDPSLSLFTHNLVAALRGDPGALDDRFLTIASLFDFVSTNVERYCQSSRMRQTPSLQESVSGGLIVVGDFHQVISHRADLDLAQHPIDSLQLLEKQKEYTKAILTEWHNRAKTPEQLEYAANTTDALEPYVKERYKEARSSLRKELTFAVSQITIDGGRLKFPGGILEHRFESGSKDSGLMHRCLKLDLEWFEHPERVKILLKVLSFRPDACEIVLENEIIPLDQLAGLEANEWVIESEDEDEVICSKKAVTLTVKRDKLRFKGLDFGSLLNAPEQPSPARELFNGAVRLLAPTKAGGRTA